jgi:DNA-binding beta-propeller fold protein YncE
LRTEAQKGASLKVPLAVLFIGVAAGLFMYRASLLSVLEAIGESATDFLETHIGLAAPVHIAMSVYGTMAARVVLLVLLVAVISGLAFLLRKVMTGRLWAVAVLAAAAVVYLLVFYLLPPLSLEDGGPISWRRVIVGAAFGCTVLFAGLWIAAAWLAGRLHVPARSALLGSFLVALVSASAVASLVPHGYRLHQLTDLVIHDDAVSIALDANVNGIYINEARRRLYATGNGSDRVFAFSLDDLSAPPLLGQEGSGGSESLAFNEKDNEIYIFGNQSLRVLDADSLKILETHSFPTVSPGDARPMWDEATRRLLVTSEADEVVGKPLIVLDRNGWKIIADENLMVGNAIKHPTSSRFYLSFFRYAAELVAYDIDTLKIGAEVRTHSKRFDRLEFDTTRNEVLVTAPMEGRIYRMDADTLEPKGSFKSDFGCRSLAIDAARGVMLCASLLSNNLVAIDLATHEVVASYRLGPWLRTVVIDKKTNRAYVSSRYGIYSVDYTRRLPAAKAGS